MTVIPGSQSTGLGLTSLVMPLAMPAYPSPSSIVPLMTNATGVTRSPFTLSRQVQEWQGEMFGFDVTLPVMDEEEARVWCAWLAALRGQGGSFLLGDSSLPFGRGVAAGTPRVKGGGQSGKRLVTDGWTANAPRVRRSGDYIQLGSGSTARLHMVLLDVDADSGGNATLDIFPRLRELTTDNAEIVVNRPVGVFALGSNDRKFSVDSALLYGIQFTAVEDL